MHTHIGWLIILHLYLFSYKAHTHAHNFFFCGIKQWNQNIFIVHPSIHFYYWWCLRLSLSLSHSLLCTRSFSFYCTKAEEKRTCRKLPKKKDTKRMKKVREKDSVFELMCVRVCVCEYYCGFRQISKCTLYGVYGFNEACDLGIIRFDEMVRFCDENS